MQATTSVEASHEAVDGWLLALCLLLTFVYPATSFYQIFRYTLPRFIGAHDATRMLLLGTYSVLFSAVAVLSFSAGLKLWLVKPHAVRYARRWLLGYLFANIGYFVFWAIVVRPRETLDLAEMGWYHVVGPIGSTALWYVYLEHSKRVRQTYREE